MPCWLTQWKSRLWISMTANSKTFNCTIHIKTNCEVLRKKMYQLQEKTGSQNIQISEWWEKLKHILVYSWAGGWISYTAGSMLFVVKSYKAKKCNNGADLFFFFKVWLILSFCVMERQVTEFRFLSGQYQKKGGGELQEQIQTSNTDIYLWEN